VWSHQTCNKYTLKANLTSCLLWTTEDIMGQ
jgi:hypothetical protein